MAATLLKPMAPAQSRALAVLLLVLLIAALVAAVAVPVVMLHRYYDEHLQTLQDRYVRYQRLAQTRSALQEKLEAVGTLESRKYFLKNTTMALAQAEVQEVATAIINNNGGRIISAQIPNPKDEGRYKQVTVSFNINANIANMRKILHAIETAQPYLFIDNFKTVTTVAFNWKGQPGFEPEMNVNFDVVGYAMPEVKADAKDADKTKDGKAATKPAAKAESKSDAKPDAKVEPKADAKPDTKTSSTPDAKPKADAKPEAKAGDVKADVKPEIKPDAKADGKAQAPVKPSTEPVRPAGK